MKKIIVTIFINMMALALVLSSCTGTPAATKPTTTSPSTTASTTAAQTTIMATTTGTSTTVPTTTAPVAEKPQYGGTFVSAVANDVQSWDQVYTANAGILPAHLVYDELLSGDFTKGPSGTNEVAWRLAGTFSPGTLQIGSLASEWEIVDPTTLVYHIRPGVFFHKKPPANGREMNAYDVVAEIQRNFAIKTSTLAQGYGSMFVSATAGDKWTVTVKCIAGTMGSVFMATGEYVKIVPTEVITQYQDLKDWKNACGTGPFMLTDYVPASSTTLTRNPNYWDKDPFHPENTLPYLDVVRWLVISDTSTRLAAFRAGKIDHMDNIEWQNAADLMKTNPELKSFKYLQAPHLGIVWMRTDKPPFNDIRVRRAMSLAVDQPAILKSYYGGDGMLLTTPVVPYTEYIRMYTPLEEQSKAVQELYEFHPDQAKKLLTEAGHPNGINTEMLLTQANVTMASVLLDYWAQVGINVTLNVKDTASITSITRAFTQPPLYYSGMATANPGIFWHWRESTMASNLNRIDDATCLAAWKVINESFVVNETTFNKAWKDVGVYILEQAWTVELPTPYMRVMWYPWVKQYNGENTVGFSQNFNFPKWIWVDQDLKNTLTK